MMHFSSLIRGVGGDGGWWGLFGGRGAWVGLVVGLVVGALALGGVGNAVYAADPVFVTTPDPSSRSIPENTPAGVNIGPPISATDTDETALEYGNTLTYSLSGTDAVSFDIDASTGQLITKAPLDAETKSSYSVTVTVDDGETRDNAITQDVTITVTGVNEPPAAPAAPTVVSGPDDTNTSETDESTTSLRVVWHEPENTGDDISSYNVQYRKTIELTYGSTNIGLDGTTATITGLTADTSYHVRVRATNGEGTGPWSLVGTGSTNKENNSPPVFPRDDNSRQVYENTPAGEDIGGPVTADDADATTLTYRLEGPDAAMFAFVTSSGQIRTRSPLNHENPACGYVTTDSPTTCTYSVTVVVTDGAGGSDAKAVNIQVDNRNEPVLAPARPTVRATEKWSTRLDVSWNAPANTGPPITGYDVRYREGSSGTFLENNCGTTGNNNCGGIKGTKITIVDLNPGESHQVQVRTVLEGGSKSTWSDSGTGKTNAANKEPRFDDRPSSGDGSTRNSTYTTNRNVDENTRSGQSVGQAVRAEDGDGHKRTYKLVESANTDEARAQAAKFDINESTGQIRTKAPLSFEDTECGYDADNDATTTCTYTVKVEVWDGLDRHKVKEDSPTVDDVITVAIKVRDKSEPPAAPAVTVTSPLGNVTLALIWDAPANTGPTPITYDVQYRKGGGSFSNDNCGSTADNNCDNLSATTTTITGLEENTSYSVRVRARNAEGHSAWSRAVTVKTNKGTNAPPNFAGATATFEVAENTKAGTLTGTLIGTVTADDNDSQTVSYGLEGVDAASFSLDAKAGQIKTRSGLNHEEKGSYSVRVRANDGSDGGSSVHAVTITVTDVNEPPGKPAAPKVTATAGLGWSLDVTWNEPSGNTGKPPITDYDIRYREFGGDADDWETWSHGADKGTADTGKTDRSTKITRVAAAEDAAHLEPRTQYEVEVRATNDEGTSDWSAIGRGTTGAGNQRPKFDNTDALVTLKVDENTRSGQNVGSAVSATDADSNRLTYSLEGPEKDSFTIVSSTGQIKTRAALDFETREHYSVTVKVNDGQKKDNSTAAKSVRITVEDVDEIPPAPAAPRVAGIPGSTDSIRVTWDASANTGPPITDYEVRWGVAGSGGWSTLVGRAGADRSEIIPKLEAGTKYEVQVRAKSAEGTGDWSSSGRGSPNPDVANSRPAFSGGTRSFNVAENTVASTDIGSLVTATDADGDTLTYTLEGADANSFNILTTGGGAQIQTSAALNHEEKATYSVAVRVRDGRGGTNLVNVTIRVTDVNGEAPETPVAPTVTSVSSTSLQVNWDAPGNTGPPITDYDYRYREPAGTWTEVTNTTITGLTETITGLTASTSYDVEVRAKNAEGTSEWSNPGIGSTNAAGANNAPVFSEGGSAERSVSATSAAGTAVGKPVAATDADSGDTLSYTLEGRDAPFFDIISTTGQLTVKSGVTLIAGDTYNVTVTADDGTNTAQIAVSIEALVAPPNNAPVFTEGPTATRTVKANVAAGTNIGNALTATDEDAGDTRTYSLEGTDAASFDITESSGQLRTKSKLIDKEYSVTVVATDKFGGRGTIAVTITAEDTPGVVALAPTSPQEGDTVTATLTDADGNVTAVTWKWEALRSGASEWTTIDGATGTSYRATAADVGSLLRATAGYTDAASGTERRSAVGVTAAAVAEDDDGVVTLTPSSVTAGERVTATLSDPDGGVTGETWQWYTSASGVSGWTAIAGATSSSYTAKAGDTGSYLRASVRYTDNAGSGRTAEGVTATATAVDDDGVVTLSTTMPRVGQAVMASLSDPDGGVTGVSWGWERSGDGTAWTSIIGATSSYTPREGDVGMLLRVTASYTDAVGSGKTARAETTASVAVEALIEKYDTDGDGMISRVEALEALKDYFNDELDLTDMVRIIQEYFG